MNIQVDKDALENRSDILLHTATLLGFEGASLYVKVVAYNEIGPAESNGLRFVMADVPAKPTPAPYSGPNTTIKQIHVLFENVNPDNGGSDILTYEL